mmetsp:Transcript_32077/g.103505  ORF Transcript_32077/g.103505 Transcript_32077/m.103505 type:complete len:402 (+) Transcript_32077:102-1307(+)
MRTRDTGRMSRPSRPPHPLPDPRTHVLTSGALRPYASATRSRRAAARGTEIRFLTHPLLLIYTLDPLLQQPLRGHVQHRLDDPDDREDPADDGARRRDEPVPRHPLLLHNDRDWRQVVLEVDGRRRAVGGRVLVRVHRVFIDEGVGLAGRVVAYHLGDHLEVVHVRMAGCARQKGRRLEPVRSWRGHFASVFRRQPRALVHRQRLAVPKLVDQVRRVDERGLVVVFDRVQHQPQRARHLAHAQVPGHLAALRPVPDRSGARCRSRRVGHFDVRGPEPVIVDRSGAVGLGALEIDERVLPRHEGGRLARLELLLGPGEADAVLIVAAERVCGHEWHLGAVQVSAGGERAAAHLEARRVLLPRHAGRPGIGLHLRLDEAHDGVDLAFACEELKLVVLAVLVHP